MNIRKHNVAHKALKPPFHNTPSFTTVEYQHDQPKAAKFKTIRLIDLPVTQVYHLKQLRHFRLVAPSPLKFEVVTTSTDMADF